MPPAERIETLREKIQKLKNKSQQLSSRIKSSLPEELQSGYREKAETAAGSDLSDTGAIIPDEEIIGEMKPAIVTEDEHKFLISQYEQQVKYFSTKAQNLQQENSELSHRFNDILKDNQNLQERISVLEEERIRLRDENEGLGRKIKEFNRENCLLYTFDKIKQFGSEYARHFRDKFGMIYETAHILFSSDMPDPVKEKAKIIEQYIRQAISALNDAKKKYHFEEPDLQPINLEENVERAIAGFIAKFPLQNISITRKCPDRPIFILFDTELFGEALSNILLNSVEAMQQRGGKIDLLCETDEKKVYLKIIDNGAGIQPNLVEKAINPFFSTKDGHSGLGLTRSYWIMQLNSGDLEIESVFRQGTTVKLTMTIAT